MKRESERERAVGVGALTAVVDGAARLARVQTSQGGSLDGAPRLDHTPFRTAPHSHISRPPRQTGFLCLSLTLKPSKRVRRPPLLGFTQTHPLSRHASPPLKEASSPIRGHHAALGCPAVPPRRYAGEMRCCRSGEREETDSLSLGSIDKPPSSFLFLSPPCWCWRNASSTSARNPAADHVRLVVGCARRVQPIARLPRASRARVRQGRERGGAPSCPRLPVSLSRSSSRPPDLSPPSLRLNR